MCSIFSPSVSSSNAVNDTGNSTSRTFVFWGLNPELRAAGRCARLRDAEEGRREGQRRLRRGQELPGRSARRPGLSALGFRAQA